MHNVFARLFDGRLIFPPISRERRILECGFGTASWAMEVAELNPNCEVSSQQSFCLGQLSLGMRTGGYRILQPERSAGHISPLLCVLFPYSPEAEKRLSLFSEQTI